MSKALVAGDDDSISIQLTRDGATFSIDTGATVKAAITSLDRQTVLAGPVTCLSNATGADWSTGLVVAPFASADTGSMTTFGSLRLEVEVDDSGKQTYSDGITVISGAIP